MTAQIFLLNTDGRWTEPHDPLTGHRSESWRVDLLSNDDVVVARLLGVTGGSFSFNVNSVIRGGGSLSYSGPEIDWNQHRVQPWYRAEAAGEFVEWPLGVFLVATPRTSYKDAGSEVSLELYDKTLILDEDKVPSTYQVGKGTNIIAAVRTVLSQAGQKRVALETTSQTLANSMVWPAGTSRLRIINDLLEAANYFSLWADGNGVFRAAPYLRPSERGSSWAFRDDSQSIYSPEFTHDFDTFEVPNRVICVGQGDGDAEPPVAVAEDNGSGPFSFRSRGRWITRVEEGQEASDLPTLKAIAQRLLTEGQQVGSVFEISHAPVPLDLNASVAFERSVEKLELVATVQTISYSMGAGELCSTTLREYRDD